MASRSRSRNMCGRSSSSGMPLVWLIHSSTSRTPCSPRSASSEGSPGAAPPQLGSSGETFLQQCWVSSSVLAPELGDERRTLCQESATT